MMGKSIFLASCAAMALASFTGPAAAQNNNAPQGQADNRTLEDRVKALEQELDQKNADDAARLTRLSTLEQQFADTVWTFDNARPTVTSSDGRFTMAIRARFQFDAAGFSQDGNLFNTTPTKNVQFKDLASGAMVRRFFLGLEGRAARDFWYEARLDLGGANGENGNPIVNLARVAYNFGNVAYPSQPHFRINVGVIQPIFTLEDTISSGALTFLERADVMNVVTGSFGGSDGRRGAELTFQQADLLTPGDNLVLSGAFAGQQTTNGTSNNAGDEGTQALGRLAYRVWSDGFSNVQLGTSAADIINAPSSGLPNAPHTLTFQDRPEIRIDGNRLVSTGAINARSGWLYGFDAAANIQNFYIAGEYYKFGADRDTTCTPCGGGDDPDFSGWYVAASWIITGETKAYSPVATNNEMGAFNAPRIITPFSLNSGTWGGWELAARYSDLNLNWNAGMLGAACTVVGCIRGGEEKIWTLAVNWYLNNNVRVMFNYLITDVDKLGTAAPFPQIGQNFNTIAVRVQFTN